MEQAADSAATPEPTPKQGRAKRSVPRWRRWSFRGIYTLLSLIGLYFAIAVIGLLPANSDFVEDPDGIEIFVSSNGVHADVIMPLVHPLHDWRTAFPAEHFADDVSAASHIAVGWGDKGFYLHTPTWDDVKLSTALTALFTPSPCCLHAVMLGQPRVSESTRSVRISEEQYKRMIAAIETCYQPSPDRPTLIEGYRYTPFDAFYEAAGNYHCLNTCNSWVGWVMRESGIKTPLLTPAPQSMFLYLPE